MEAQGAHRRAGDTRGAGGGDSDYIAKHVGIQNQVLRWLQHFSDRVEERAKGATAEVNGLLEEAGALELDMKTAVVAFDHLTRQSPLPHIIGSEEYNHDNSCGLAVFLFFQIDDAQTITDDFSWLREFQMDSSDSGPDDLFGSQMLGVQQCFQKGETDSLVSASREFKAMLEAALVNPYRFCIFALLDSYQADLQLASSGFRLLALIDDPALSARMGGAAGERSAEADNAEEAELLASLQNPDINVHDIYSALVREGLFDDGDKMPAVDPASGSANPAVEDSAESASPVNETVLSEEEILVEGDNTASPSDKKDGVSESS
ncbi:hypothetical protein BAE44_0011878 [Dichanthelium oligosanthes]|uniref:Uncharacterized protein n=1 Tax=Dichanthelium oligosanthes TaxID=888268 RepID=A0A1E5VPQ3_9POAL|nr:hypothetical protein BAE44_0011878 [Dichanthelium oligosanthes]